MPESNAFSRLQKEQLRAVAEPIWRNVIEAARVQDYARFSRGFCDELRAKLSEEHFRESCKEFPVLTSIRDEFELIDTLQREQAITFLWRLASDRFAGEFLGQLTLQHGDAGLEISAVSIT